MTETRRWLERWGVKLHRRLLFAAAGLVLGLVFTAFGIGLFLGRVGVYRWIPPFVFFGWLAAGGAAVWGALWAARRFSDLCAKALARAIELEGGLRHGSIVGVAEHTRGSGSAALAALADRRAASWLNESGAAALGRTARQVNRSLGVGGVVFALGGIVFLGVGPTGSTAGQFWNPVATVLGGRGPVRIWVDRTVVPYGDSVQVQVEARSRRTATLWVRAPGEAWTQTQLSLDSTGRSATSLGPLDGDRFLRATSGGRSSITVRVELLLPVFLREFQIVARFPEYIDRADEPVLPGRDSLRLPMGTTLIASGRATVSLRSAEWRSGERSVSLESDGERFNGSLPVTASRRWLLDLITEDGRKVDDDLLELNVVAVADSTPVVAIPIPGTDSTVPSTLRVPLVVDARDDHGLEYVELVHWRVSESGRVGDSVTVPLTLHSENPDRAVIQWLLDLSGGGFLAGDTAFFFARAQDNAPAKNIGRSEVYRGWVPTLAELRDAVRGLSEAIAQGADSLAEEQRDLTRDMEDLAAERERSDEDSRFDANRTEEELPFNSAERARELIERQSQAMERAAQLREELQQLSDAAWSAGITDPEFHRQLQELQDLLSRALTEDLMARLDQLRDAIQQLDAEAVREALRQLAESAQGLQQQLIRGQELFERAAIEGTMETLAGDAAELAALQREWNEDVVGDADGSDLARREEALAEQTRNLSGDMLRLEEALEQAQMSSEQMHSTTERTDDAAGEMQNAASQAAQAQRREAQRSGESASQSLEAVADDLRQQREETQEQWRREVLDAMDRALVETAKLAEGQQDVVRRLDRGESGSDLTGGLAALRAGLDRLVMRLQGAAGRNALVSPQLGAALGFSRLRMSEALDQLQRANPNTRQAEELAGEALDGLNAVALQLLRSRSDVASAESGTGFSEALERLAELAQQQGQIGEQTNELMSLVPQGVPQVMQQLRQVAERQQEIADELQNMEAEGEVGGADELAEEARQLAALLEAARVDRETVERQEQLFRRMLDAGRSLRSEEEDESEERRGRTADPNNVRPPPSGPLTQVGGPRFRFPEWEELRSLSPEERRLVLDYFRRLNGGRP